MMCRQSLVKCVVLKLYVVCSSGVQVGERCVVQVGEVR